MTFSSYYKYIVVLLLICIIFYIIISLISSFFTVYNYNLESIANKNDDPDLYSKNDPDTYNTTFVDPESSLYFFNKTEHHISCCANLYKIPHLYTGTEPEYRTSGCPCKTREQYEYLANHGNNSTS